MLDIAIEILIEENICIFCKYFNDKKRCKEYSKEIDVCKAFLFEGLQKK